jgi:trehalose 6-phosphate phosphatase
MDMNSNNTPVLTDTAPITNSRLHVHSNLLPYSHTGATFPHGMLLNIPRKKTGILEDVFSCGWLDAMKSSSPPPKNKTKDVNHGYASSEADPYFNWLVLLHTSLFHKYQSFLQI